MGLVEIFNDRERLINRVTILNENPSESTVKIRIEQGEFKGKEALANRNAIRIAE